MAYSYVVTFIPVATWARCTACMNSARHSTCLLSMPGLGCRSLGQAPGHLIIAALGQAESYSGSSDFALWSMYSCLCVCSDFLWVTVWMLAVPDSSYCDTLVLASVSELPADNHKIMNICSRPAHQLSSKPTEHTGTLSGRPRSKAGHSRVR